MKKLIVPTINSSKLTFWCPGCKCGHYITDAWKITGTDEEPTVTPSVLVKGAVGNPPRTIRCHLFIKQGMIQFLNDCDHELAGQVVQMEEL